MNTELEIAKKEKEALLSEKWAALEGAIPEKYREEILAELKKIYALYKPEDAVKWLASLYDPETGGFYCSRSAKETEGFGPDIEDTYFGLALVGWMGMAEKFEGKWWKAMPRDISEKAAYWLQSLQDEDSYFYLPQWPKEYIMENRFQSRITRDRGSAKEVMNRLEVPEKYPPKPRNESGEKESKQSLLSQYDSTESFKAYLDGFEEELKTKTPEERAFRFYYYGNLFQSTVGHLTDEMKKMVIDFFDRHQNPENGMWADMLCRNATNGIHKICSVYNALGVEMKYADKIINSTLEILMWDKVEHPSSTTCDIYNVWSCFQYIYKNIREFSAGTKEEKEARCERMKELVYKKVAEAIRITYGHLVDYAYPDGSFSYHNGYSLHHAQGCPTAVRGTKEGDISGFLLAVEDMPKYILSALDLLDYRIPIFAEYDRLIYIDGIRNAKPAVKRPMPKIDN